MPNITNLIMIDFVCHHITVLAIFTKGSVELRTETPEHASRLLMPALQLHIGCRGSIAHAQPSCAPWVS